MIGLVVALLTASGGALPETGTILEALNAARAEQGVPALKRDATLDRAAEERARGTAARPEGRRFASEEPIDALLERAGLRRYRRASQYLAYQSGYDDPSAAAVRQWRDYGPAWDRVVDPRWSDVGIAWASAPDGTLVIAAVLVEREIGAPDLSAIEARVHEAVNVARMKGGLPPLTRDPSLDAVARAHSADMVRRGFFAHASPDGAGPADRLANAGIRFARVAENLARSLREEDAVAATVEGWMGSEGHRANLFGSAFTLTGVGVAVREEDGEIVFTQVFSVPQAADP